MCAWYELVNGGSVWRPGLVSVVVCVCCTIIVLWPRHYRTVQRPVSVGFPSFECCMVRFFWLRFLTLASRACLFIGWCAFSRTCARITTLFVVLRRQRAELPTNDSPTWDISVLHHAGLQGTFFSHSFSRSDFPVPLLAVLCFHADDTWPFRLLT